MISDHWSQPLDIYFFRQYKIVARKMIAYIRRWFLSKESLIKPNNRYFIIIMHALIYNQFQSPKFHKMLLYAWHKGGYNVKEFDPHIFENANQVLFQVGGQKCTNCTNISFIYDVLILLYYPRLVIHMSPFTFFFHSIRFSLIFFINSNCQKNFNSRILFKFQ